MFEKITKLFDLNKKLENTAISPNSNKFLLEVLSEEIPFSIHHNILLFLEKEISKINFLDKLKTEVNISKNRVTIEIFNLPNFFKTEDKKIKAPKISGDKIQIESFCKKYFCTVEDLVAENENYFLIQKGKQILIENFLETFCVEIINHLSNFFKDGVKCLKIEKTWIMPIFNICACLNEKIIDFRIGNLNSNNKTFVDINFQMKEITISATDYGQKLKDNYILYKKKDRINLLKNACENIVQFLEKDKGKKIFVKNERIFQEISCIVDFPFPLICKIPKKCFVAINEVLTLTLEKNQKYIILCDENQDIVENFIAICEGPRDFITAEKITGGYEKVAINRIDDAIFYQNKDSQIDLPSLNKKLEKINFYNEISLKDFVFKYNADLINKLSLQAKSRDLNFDIINKLNFICKTDLATNLTAEFPELQGIVGYNYIKMFWYKDLSILSENLEDFASIVKYQYSSINIYRNLIEKNFFKKELLIFNLASKVSTINILWKNEKPTGSGDPFALKKVVDDIFYIMLLLAENKFNVNLANLIDNDIYSNFEEYFIQRILKQLIKNQENFKEEDILSIKNSIKKEGASSEFLQKLENTINLKNNFNQNKELFLLIKRLLGFKNEAYAIEYKEGDEVEQNIFDFNNNLNFTSITQINKWLDTENVLHENDKVKTTQSLIKIKKLIQELNSKLIL